MSHSPYERDNPDNPDDPVRDPSPRRDGGPDSADNTGSTAANPDGAVTSTFDVREAGRAQPGDAPEADRPSPRAGLVGATRAMPSDAAEDDRAAAASRRRTHPDRDVALDGTTSLARPASRKGAHVGTVLLTLLLTPVAWYLLADAGARLTLPQDAPWTSGTLNVAALLELVGGLLVLAVVLLAARRSSLGAIVTGSLVLVAGVPFVAAPTWTQELLEPVVAWLADLGDVGRNVAHHLEASGSTGRLVVYGLALILVGVVSHGARRKGRDDARPVG